MGSAQWLVLVNLFAEDLKVRAAESACLKPIIWLGHERGQVCNLETKKERTKWISETSQQQKHINQVHHEDQTESTVTFSGSTIIQREVNSLGHSIYKKRKLIRTATWTPNQPPPCLITNGNKDLAHTITKSSGHRWPEIWNEYIKIGTTQSKIKRALRSTQSKSENLEENKE